MAKILALLSVCIIAAGAATIKLETGVTDDTSRLEKSSEGADSNELYRLLRHLRNEIGAIKGELIVGAESEPLTYDKISELYGRLHGMKGKLVECLTIISAFPPNSEGKEEYGRKLKEIELSMRNAKSTLHSVLQNSETEEENEKIGQIIQWIFDGNFKKAAQEVKSVSYLELRIATIVERAFETIHDEDDSNIVMQKCRNLCYFVESLDVDDDASIKVFALEELVTSLTDFINIKDTVSIDKWSTCLFRLGNLIRKIQQELDSESEELKPLLQACQHKLPLPVRLLTTSTSSSNDNGKGLGFIYIRRERPYCSAESQETDSNSDEDQVGDQNKWKVEWVTGEPHKKQWQLRLHDLATGGILASDEQNENSVFLQKSDGENPENENSKTAGLWMPRMMTRDEVTFQNVLTQGYLNYKTGNEGKCNEYSISDENARPTHFHIQSGTN